MPSITLNTQSPAGLQPHLIVPPRRGWSVPWPFPGAEPQPGSAGSDGPARPSPGLQLPAGPAACNPGPAAGRGLPGAVVRGRLPAAPAARRRAGFKPAAVAGRVFGCWGGTRFLSLCPCHGLPPLPQCPSWRRYQHPAQQW